MIIFAEDFTRPKNYWGNKIERKMRIIAAILTMLFIIGMAAWTAAAEKWRNG